MAVKLGFVGCGGIAQTHFGILEKMEEVRIIAVCDVDPERAEAAARRFDANTHLNASHMLEVEQLDALYVCVPPFAHSEVESLAAKNGVHLFVEKPVNLSLERAKVTAQELKGRGVTSCVGYHWRYLESVKLAREKIGDKPISLMLGYFMSRMPRTPWWRVREKSGGQVVEQTTHVFDLARFFGGEVAAVAAAASGGLMEKLVEDFDVDDASSVVLKFRQGAVANITSACIMPERARIGLTVLCEGTVIKIEPEKVTLEEKGKLTEILCRDDPYLAENLAFINALKTGDASAIKSDYADGVKTLAVTLAANESMKTGKTVSL